MKTKNIFRMLLVAAALLLGANNVKADQTLWQGNPSVTLNSQDGDRIYLTYNQVKGINSGDIIRIHGSITNTEVSSRGVWINNAYNNSVISIWVDWEEIFTNGVVDLEFTDSNISNLILYDWENNPLLPFINGYNVTITKIELITSSSSGSGTNYYSVAINAGSNGTVTASKTSDITSGEEVTLTITPADNYELDNISAVDASNNAVTLNGSGNTRTFTMPASNVTITATFKNSESEPVAPTAPADIENEHSLWTGSVKAESSDGHLTETISASLFANIKAGDSFRVYVTDINTSQNWKLWITNSASGWATQVFEGFDGGDITNDNVGSALHNEDGYSYFEFTCSETTASSFKANGTQMSFTWMTVLKVSYISNESVEPESYDITVSSTTNGTVTASAESATQGTEVTLTITPADNYELDNISVVDASNNAVTLNGNGNTRTFTMPASNVTVSATFKATEATTYSISVSTQGNGSATVSESEAEAGTTIYITTRPSNGYEVESVYASGASVTQSTANRYYFTMPASDVTVTVTFTAIQQGNSNYVTATIGSTGYATFSSSSALDFSGLTDVEAFYASSQSGSIVYLTQITGTVEAYTGMIIRGSAGTYYIPKTSSGSSYDNLLVAGNGTELSYSTSEDDYFVLVERSGSPVFVQIYDDPATVYLGQAYLSLSKNRARARSLSIKFGNGEGTTGISGIENETTGDNVIYNLSGQRVEKPTKGLYIINGKKVLIK